LEYVARTRSALCSRLPQSTPLRASIAARHAIPASRGETAIAKRLAQRLAIALLKRCKHVIAKHDIAAMFEEVELIRHGVQAGMSDSSRRAFGITGMQ
jgi:hypothetical protein